MPSGTIKPGRAAADLTMEQLRGWATFGPGVAATWRLGQRSRFSLPSTDLAVPVARDMAALWLSHEGIERTPGSDGRDIALLVVSELVTNAYEHTTTSRIIVRLSRQQGAVLIEVLDTDGTGAPNCRTARDDEDGGRGLLLVRGLAERWGFHQAEGKGSTVWARIRIFRAMKHA